MAFGTPVVGTLGEGAAVDGETGLTLSSPATTTGDLMLTFLNRGTVATEVWDTITDWTLLLNVNQAAGRDLNLALYGKFAASADDGDYTFTLDSTSNLPMSGYIIAFPGGHASTILDVAYVEATHANLQSNKPTPNTDAFREITTATDGARVIAWEVISHNDINSSTEDPSGYTEVARHVGSSPDYQDRQMIIHYKDIATAGAETPGAAAYTSDSDFQESIQVTIALKPAAAGAAFIASLPYLVQRAIQRASSI